MWVFVNIQCSGSLNWVLTGTGPLSAMKWKSWFMLLCVCGVLTGENSESTWLFEPLSVPNCDIDTCSCSVKQSQQNVCKILTHTLSALWCSRSALLSHHASCLRGNFYFLFLKDVFDIFKTLHAHSVSCSMRQRDGYPTQLQRAVN